MVFFKTSLPPATLTILLKWMLLELDSKLHKRTHFFFSAGQPVLMTATLLQPSHWLKQLRGQSNRFLKSRHNILSFLLCFYNTNAVVTLSCMKEWPTCFIFYIPCTLTTSYNPQTHLCSWQPQGQESIFAEDSMEIPCGVPAVLPANTSLLASLLDYFR